MSYLAELAVHQLRVVGHHISSEVQEGVGRRRVQQQQVGKCLGREDGCKGRVMLPGWERQCCRPSNIQVGVRLEAGNSMCLNQPLT